jgi:hypothetical protein
LKKGYLNMQKSIKIDTGELHIAITDENDNFRGEIKFNPKDVIFAERFYRLVSDFQEKQKEYLKRYEDIQRDKEVDEQGIPLNLNKQIELVKETCLYIREQIDHVFGEGTSQTVFGDGMVLEVFEQFFDGIAPFIQTTRTGKIGKYIPNFEKPVKGHRRPRK